MTRSSAESSFLSPPEIWDARGEKSASAPSASASFRDDRSLRSGTWIIVSPSVSVRVFPTRKTGGIFTITTALENFNLLACIDNLLYDTPPICLEIVFLLLESIKQVSGCDLRVTILRRFDLRLRGPHDQMNEKFRPCYRNVNNFLTEEGEMAASILPLRSIWSGSL
jgi:hypothetical protein